MPGGAECWTPSSRSQRSFSAAVSSHERQEEVSRLALRYSHTVMEDMDQQETNTAVAEWEIFNIIEPAASPDEVLSLLNATFHGIFNCAREPSPAPTCNSSEHI